MQRNFKRDYKREYEHYQGTEVQKKHRALRNKARRTLMKKGLVHRGDHEDVAHKVALSRGGSNQPSNWSVESASSNRSFRRSGHSLASEVSKREQKARKSRSK